MRRVVDGYDALSGSGVGVAAGVDSGVGFGVEGVCEAVGIAVGVGLTEEAMFGPLVFFGGSILAELPEFI